jgi:hypothetical protein
VPAHTWTGECLACARLQDANIQHPSLPTGVLTSALPLFFNGAIYKISMCRGRGVDGLVWSTWKPGLTGPDASGACCLYVGSGAWKSLEVCCSPAVAFPEGCTERPSECWGVENFAARTCTRDDRRCMQGGVTRTLCSTCCIYPGWCTNCVWGW